jgi:hypothetical protein
MHDVWDKDVCAVRQQVTCVYRKELGVYGRYTLYQMITLGYQTRSAIVAAGSYGVPQVWHF